MKNWKKMVLLTLGVAMVMGTVQGATKDIITIETITTDETISATADTGLFVDGTGINSGWGKFLENLLVTTNGDNAIGISLDSGRLNVSKNLTINTIGDNSLGIINTESRFGVQGDTLITTTGDNSTGFLSIGDGNYMGSFSTLQKMTIQTAGANSHGIEVNQGAITDIRGDNFITTQGADAYGVKSVDDYSQVWFHGSSVIETKGNGADGVYARKPSDTITEGAVTFEGTSMIRTEGENAIGVNVAADGLVIFKGESQIRTKGDNAADGIYAFDGGKVVFEAGSLIETQGDDSYGVWANYDGKVDFKGNSTIFAYGDMTEGISTVNGSKVVFDSNATIKTTGYLSSGVRAWGGGQVFFNGNASQLNISTTGDGSKALSANDAGMIAFNGLDAQLNVSATGANSYAIVADGAGSMIGGGTGQSKIIGDMKAANDGIILLVVGKESLFTGKTIQESGGNVTLGFHENSIWNVTGDSNLQILGFDGLKPTNVNFVGNSGYSTLTITGQTTPTNNGRGQFNMRADLASDPTDNKFDRLLINTHNTNDILAVRHTGTGAITNLNNEFEIATVGAEVGSFKLAHLVDAGAYQYDLKTDTSGSDTKYLLYNTKKLSTAALAAPNISKGAYFTNYAETNSLMKRMGDLRADQRNGDVWGRVFGGKISVDGSATAMEFKQDYTGFQVGADRKYTQNHGEWYLGGMIGYTQANQDYLNAGSGSSKSMYLGAYGTYHKPETGFYVDTVLKAGSMKNEMNLIQSGGYRTSDDDRASVFSGSVEVGQRFFVKDQKERQGFYVEPQMKLAYSRIGSTDYTFTGAKVENDSMNSIIGRVGTLVGYEMKKGENPINLYGKISWLKEFDGDSTSKISGVSITHDGSDSWWSYGLGVTAKVKDRHNLYLDVERANGGDFTQNWQLNLGYRLQF